MDRGTRNAVIGVVVLALAGGGYLFWRHRQAPAAVVPGAAGMPPAAASNAPPPAPEPTPPPAPSPSAVKHPVPAAGAERLPPLDKADDFAKKLLSELLGGRRGLSFLVAENLVRRFVATVDNLGRDDASPGMWPVTPTPGHFQTTPATGGDVVAGANADRYAPFVSVAAAVDARAAVAVYRRLYPLFQQAYEDLGNPGRYFNDRVVEVIDSLLQTPDLTGPIHVKRAEVPDAAAPKTAGGIFLFADPALESRPAGQKILLRMGPANAAKLKAKLGELRRLLAT